MKHLQLLLIVLFSSYSFAEPCKEDNDPTTELNLAIRELVEQKQDSKAIQLLANGFPANSANAYGATLLHIASIMNNVELAGILIDNGGNPNARNHLGQTPVFLASNWSNNEILSMLLDNGGDPNVQVDQTSIYNTALIIAVVNRNIEGIRLLIKAGANPEHKNAKGLSALSIAAEANNKELTNALSTSQP